MQARSTKNSQSRPAAAGESELTRAANLGPKSVAVLASVGIKTLADLNELGSAKAYCIAKKAEPSVTLNLLWALEGAILGQHWQEVAREHRTSLLLALDDHESRVAKL